MQEQTFETLYGVDKGNKIKEWSIKVINNGDHSVILTTYGQLTGKKVDSSQIVSSGKNIGKKNETTHYEQAIMDAQSKWKKKRDINGYRTNKMEVEKGLQNDGADNTFSFAKLSDSLPSLTLPMLAQNYKKHARKVVYPCYIQPKLDGYRMIYNPVTKTMTTRTGKEYKVLYSTKMYDELQKTNLFWDGELYVHDPTFRFEQYGVLRKQKGLTSEEKRMLDRIEYHVYDCLHISDKFQQRIESIRKVFSSKEFEKIKLVETISCQNIDQVDEQHKEFINRGYEGSMLRNAHGLYKGKFRSFDLLKYKDFDDNEFEITGFTSEMDTRGNNEDMIVWICKTESGIQFNVQSKGTKEERQAIYRIAGNYIGRQLWVQHFGFTQDGIPRFPKTMRNGLESIRNQVL
jgi:ATP-dependent DNA ligase